MYPIHIGQHHTTTRKNESLKTVTMRRKRNTISHKRGNGCFIQKLV